MLEILGIIREEKKEGNMGVGLSTWYSLKKQRGAKLETLCFSIYRLGFVLGKLYNIGLESNIIQWCMFNIVWAGFFNYFWLG